MGSIVLENGTVLILCCHWLQSISNKYSMRSSAKRVRAKTQPKMRWERPWKHAGNGMQHKPAICNKLQSFHQKGMLCFYFSEHSALLKWTQLILNNEGTQWKLGSAQFKMLTFKSQSIVIWKVGYACSGSAPLVQHCIQEQPWQNLTT